MSNIDCERYIKNFRTKDFIPIEIVHFLKEMYALEWPIIKKKCQHSVNTAEHAQGKSMLSRKDLFPYVHLTKAEERLLLLCQIAFPQQMQDTEFVKAIKKLHLSCTNKKFAKSLLQAYLAEDEAFYQEQAETDPVFSFVCYFVSYMTFMPFFMYTQSSLEQKYDEAVWHYGHCPYCGGAPLLSYLKEKEGRRVHACSQCLALYRTPRIQCPICLEDKQKKLNYFTSDTDKECQICHCKSCNNYTKIIDYREYADFKPLPLLDDLASITLDIICEQQKFQKPVLSLWL